MNIFEATSSNLREQFSASLGSWNDVFSIETLQRLITTLKMVKDDSLMNLIYPTYSDVFKIYQDCAPNKVRVVILGQDPYFNGNANGYAFGCKFKISPSLKSIIDSIESTCDDTGIKKDIGLRYLVEQGVFLLNTILTVRAGVPLSHVNLGWQEFTTQTIKILNESNTPIVFLLWGSKAKGYQKYITNELHMVFTDTHPASASYNNENWSSPNFKQTNDFFQAINQPLIQWK